MIYEIVTPNQRKILIYNYWYKITFFVPSDMAPPTIDPLIRLRPSENLLKVVSYLYTLNEQYVSDGVNSATPDGILSSVNGSPAKSQEILYSVEDIKWIYDRKKLLKDSDNEELGIENTASLR